MTVEIKKVVFMNQIKLEEISKLENEIEFITNYREINFDLFKMRPNKKSKFYKIEDYESMLEKQNEKNIVSGSGFTKYTWKEVFENKELLEKVIMILKKEPSPRDQLEAFINANFVDGNIFVIEKGEVKINTEVNSITKNIFIIKSEAKILHEFNGKNLLINNTIYFEENTNDVVLMHVPQNQTGIINFSTIAKQNVDVTQSVLWFNGEKTKSSYINFVDGDGVTIKQNDLLFLNKEQQIDVDMIALHKGKSSLTDTKLKCALKDKAKQSFDGMIKIIKGAQATDSYLEANSMLLSDNARSINVPKLEIEADDVKATHSATVEHLEEEKIFYLQTRGLSEKNAKELIISSFLQGTTTEYPKFLREKIRESIEKKLNEK